jgi:hypothetical protein
VRLRTVPTPVLMWFGLLGAPFAWTLQHVTGVVLTLANCNVVGRTQWQIHLDAWTIAVTAGAVLVTLAAGVAAIATFRRTRDVGSEPPGSRVHFLSIVALTTTPLLLAIMLMSGVGSILQAGCPQS